jgi:plasmid maintenance system killer protein
MSIYSLHCGQAEGVHDRRFLHKGLRAFFEDDDRSKINSEHVAGIRLILSALDQAGQVEDMRQPTVPAARVERRPQGLLGSDRARQLADHFSVRRRPSNGR